MAGQVIVLVDVAQSERLALRAFFSERGHDVVEAGGYREAVMQATTQQPTVVVVDASSTDVRAAELVARLRGLRMPPAVIVLTSATAMEAAVECIRAGASHILVKPLDGSQMRRVLEGAIARGRHDHPLSATTAVTPFIGPSAAMQELRDACTRVLNSDSPVLLLGETGTGKGIIARWLHAQGPRSASPFVDLNCAGLSRDFVETELFGHTRGAFTGAAQSKTGLMEVANHGTLFLDEIGDMAPEIQAKVLKVVEEKMFRRMGGVREERTDVRIICATLQDLEHLVRTGSFRRDLYYRIGAITLRVPSLRERHEDIPVLARELLAGITARARKPHMELGSSAIAAMLEHGWPGNVRELKNVLERAVLMTDSLTLEADALGLKPRRAESTPTPQVPAHWTLDECERHHIAQVLRSEGGRVDVAAQRLGIGRSTLYQKIHRFQLARS